MDNTHPFFAELVRGIEDVFYRHVPGISADTVQVNHSQGGYRATRHLLGLEHRMIGCISGPSTTSIFPLRVDGYRRALAGAGIAPRAERVVEAGMRARQPGRSQPDGLLPAGKGR